MWPRRRTSSSASVQSLHESEGTHDAVAGRREQLRDDGERLVLRTAVGVHQRTRSRAEPGAANRIRHQRAQGVVELSLGVDLHGRPVRDERGGDLLEILHVRPEYDWLAEDRRLEDVVSAVVRQTATDEHGRGELI